MGCRVACGYRRPPPADGRVVASLRAAMERLKAIGRVEVPEDVSKERFNTGGSVPDAVGVANERVNTVRRVLVATKIATERFNAGRRVGVAFGVVKKGECSDSGVIGTERVVNKRPAASVRIA